MIRWRDHDLTHWHTKKEPTIMNLVTLGALCGIVALVILLIILL